MSRWRRNHHGCTQSDGGKEGFVAAPASPPPERPPKAVERRRMAFNEICFFMDS
jgi:hypothetical protein